MILKLMGGVLCVLCGTMLGLGRLREIKRQLSVMEGMDASLALMESEIALCERPLPDIFEKLSFSCSKNSSAFIKMREICLERSAAEAWNIGIESLELSGEAEKALLSLGVILGTTDGERQSAEIESTRKILSAIIEKQRRQIAEKGKSYPLLGFCFAGIAALMLI